MSKRNHWDKATLSQYPKWFTEMEDSIEFLGKVLRNEAEPKAEDIEKKFESVFVVGVEFNQENDTKGGDDVEAAQIFGFDTIKEMSEELLKEWSKQEIKFVYHTRKKRFMECTAQLMIQLEEMGKEDGAEEVEVAPVAAPSVTIPGLSRNVSPALNETQPGKLGPKRSS